MIANTVKWTTHDPCLVLQFVKVIQNYTLPLNFVKKKHRHIDLQCQAIYDDKKNPEKSLHIWEDVARGVQVGDIEQVIVQKLFKNDKTAFNWFFPKKFVMVPSIR